MDSETGNFNEYGIDDNGPTPPVQTNNHVVVPRSLVELSDDEEAFLHSHIEPLFDDGDYGISLYRRTVNLVAEFQQDLDHQDAYNSSANSGLGDENEHDKPNIIIM